MGRIDGAARRIEDGKRAHEAKDAKKQRQMIAVFTRPSLCIATVFALGVFATPPVSLRSPPLPAVRDRGPTTASPLPGRCWRRRPLPRPGSGRRAQPRAARRGPGGRPRRIRLHRRGQRVGQEHAALPARRPGPADAVRTPSSARSPPAAVLIDGQDTWALDDAELARRAQREAGVRLPVPLPAQGILRPGERVPADAEAGPALPPRRDGPGGGPARPASGWATSAAARPTASAAASSSASPSPAPWPTSRPCCWPTSPPATSTAPTASGWPTSSGAFRRRAGHRHGHARREFGGEGPADDPHGGRADSGGRQGDEVTG